MWGSMVVLIPRTGVTHAATAALARALGDVPFVVVERSLSTDTDRHGAASDHRAASDQGSAAAESEAIARQLPAGVLAYDVVVVGQGDGAQVAIELARRLEQPGARDSGLATGGVSAVIVVGALPSRAGQSPDSPDSSGSPGSPQTMPIAAPLHVWAGTEGLSAPAGQRMLGWCEVTDATTTFRSFAGSDDFLLTRVSEVATQLRRVLAVPSASEVLDVS